MAENNSVLLAVALTLFASAMWGSWMQIIKRCPQYPVYGTTLVIYAVSFALLSAACLAAGKWVFPQGLVCYIRAYRGEILRIVIGGGVAALSVLVSLQLMRNAGLVVGTAVSGAAGSITGVLVAVAKEGLPGVPYAGAALALCTAVTVLAGILCSCASAANAGGSPKERAGVGLQSVLLLAAFVVLNNGYIYATSTGTKARMNPLVICLFMSAGAFALTFLVSLVTATVKGQWKEILCIGKSKKPLLFGAAAAVCHYGGNLLSVLCMPVLSATLSFLIGRSANIWTFFFGIRLGEFKGAGKKVRIFLTAGILLYMAGILLIAFFFY